VQRFSAEVPQIWQWDDHEVTNNWSDIKVLDARYTSSAFARCRQCDARVPRLLPDAVAFAGRGRSASIGTFLTAATSTCFVPRHAQLTAVPTASTGRRSRAPDTAFLRGRSAQLAQGQAAGVARDVEGDRADMPIGLLVPDGNDAQGRAQFEAIANGDGAVLGRELEIADLLRFIKREGVVNTVWITADVHYCAAHFYDPGKAQFRDFAPFWEFVAGPLHAGSFRAERARQYLRTAARIPEIPGNRERAAECRVPVLRAGRYRPSQQGDGRGAQGHQRPRGVLEAARCPAPARPRSLEWDDE